ncbi:hypothetical protein [Pseudoalteromonas sp. S1612]|uniref:hypothetical protein n=1 Tax=Pseudoalteromonas sp. S1612 TaxID=579507 RepID=UPI00110B728B|nr:hypothetical protein [Pseudoalteromonas sp. S1612]TMP52356.1 hypothetical protein CWB78_16475 [Pseudoalteromonas sp. S1612]
MDDSSCFLPSEFYSIYFSFLWKLLLPTVLYAMFLYTFLSEFFIGALFIVSNSYEPMYANDFSFFFMEAEKLALLIREKQ